MPKWTNDLVLEAALSFIVSNSTKMTVCTSQPTTYAQATSLVGGGGYKLAEIAIGSGDFSAFAEGLVDGRRTSVAQKADLDVLASGTSGHIVLVQDSPQRILHITTCPPQTLTSGNKVTVPTWDIEFGDPINP